VLLASGYIAGGTLCGLIIAFFTFLPDNFNRSINLGAGLGHSRIDEESQKKLDESLAKAATDEERAEIRTSAASAAWLESNEAKIAALLAFAALAALLMLVGVRKNPELEEPNPPGPV